MRLVEHLEKLRHFHRLASHSSISEAAKLIGISQAGLSKSLSALESALEARLFVRSSGGLVLTKEGEILLKSTKRIIDEANQVETEVRSLRAAVIPKRIRIGMYDSIAAYFWADLGKYLHQVYRELEVELLVDTSKRLAKALREKDIDIAVGVNLHRSTHRAEFFELFEDHYSFYVAPDLVARSEREALPFIMHPSANDNDSITVAEHLTPLLRKRRGYRVPNFETLKTLTMQGHGIGVLPTQVAKPLVAMKQLEPFEINKFPRLFGPHKIGFLADANFLSEHREFADDIYRLGGRWAKS